MQIATGGSAQSTGLNTSTDLAKQIDLLSKIAVAALCWALLNETVVSVRRTAGDAVSDIGDAEAEAEADDGKA